jgi:7-cyano-7-deazaguanine synthase
MSTATENIPPSSATVLLSGGLDSATALGDLRDRDVSTDAIYIDYGQPARREEAEASKRLAAALGVPLRRLDVTGLDIANGEIRGRNALLLLTALMAVDVPGSVVIAIHRGTRYWDCSQEFLEVMQALFDGYTGGRVQLLAPFVEFEKADVVRLGVDIGVPFDLTYSCELADGPCGECVSCLDMEAHAR